MIQTEQIIEALLSDRYICIEHINPDITITSSSGLYKYVVIEETLNLLMKHNLIRKKKYPVEIGNSFIFERTYFKHGNDIVVPQSATIEQLQSGHFMIIIFNPFAILTDTRADSFRKHIAYE